MRIAEFHFYHSAFARAFIAALIVVLPNLSAAEETGPESTAQSVRMSVTREHIVAMRDERHDALDRCAPGFVPTILKHTEPWYADLGVSRIFLFTPRERIVIRRGLQTTISSPDDAASIRLPERGGSSTAFGEVSTRRGGDPNQFRNAVVDLTLYGCFSPYSFLITDGHIEINGRAESYAINVSHSLQDLAKDFGADLSVWFTSKVEVARFGKGAAFEKRPLYGWHDEEVPILGELRLNSKLFLWDFDAVAEGKPPLRAGLGLSFQFAVRDGGVFNVTE